MTERTYTPDEWAYISERGLTPGDDIEEALFQRRERDRVSTRPLTAGEIAIPTAQGVKRLIEHITDVSIQIALENEKIGAPRYLAGLKADLACSWFEMESMLSKWELKETSDWRWMNEHCPRWSYDRSGIRGYEWQIFDRTRDELPCSSEATLKDALRAAVEYLSGPDSHMYLTPFFADTMDQLNALTVRPKDGE